VVTLVVIALFPLVAGYIVLIERKVLADFQVRLGPMRVGPHGLLQPIADALKLLIKEDIIPTDADQSIFWLAPVISTFHRADCVRRNSIQQVHCMWRT
jgi:NADH-quinone oxidoreductase subunit H